MNTNTADKKTAIKTSIQFMFGSNVELQLAMPKVQLDNVLKGSGVGISYIRSLRKLAIKGEYKSMLLGIIKMSKHTKYEAMYLLRETLASLPKDVKVQLLVWAVKAEIRFISQAYKGV